MRGCGGGLHKLTLPGSQSSLNRQLAENIKNTGAHEGKGLDGKNRVQEGKMFTGWRKKNTCQAVWSNILGGSYRKTLEV